MKDTLTLTVARGNWQISRTVPLLALYAQNFAVEDLAEELVHTLNSSWQSLAPKARKEFRRKWNICSTTTPPRRPERPAAPPAQARTPLLARAVPSRLTPPSGPNL